jgi:hypothetical protein
MAPGRLQHADAGAIALTNPTHPKKLLPSEWTAAHPVATQKHSVVPKVIEPGEPRGTIEWVEIEAVHSGRGRIA